MSADADIVSALSRRLEHDEMAWQRRTRAPFHGRRPAEFLEKLLFACPHCRTFGALRSRDDVLACAACACAVRMTRHGFFRPLRGPLYFSDPAQWNAWQLPVLDAMLSDQRDSGEPIFEEHPVVLSRGYRERPLRVVGAGTASLMGDRIVLHSAGRRQAVFLHQDVRGLNVQNREKLEFYCDNALYRLDFRNPRASPYKWTKAIEILAAAAPQARSLMRVNTY